MVHRHAMNLIELLIVIFIIALLLALLFGSLNIAREKAVQIQCFNNLKQIVTASFSYSADFREYPGYVSRRPYGDYLTGRTSGSAYITDELLRCPGIVQWRGKPYERLRVYGIYEVDLVDPWDASLDIRAGRFWKYRQGVIGDDMLFYFEQVKDPSAVSFWRDCIFLENQSDVKPHWKYRRTITEDYGARLSHLRRSAGGYVDGHVESKTLAELHEEPLKIEAVFTVANEIEEIR